MRGAAGAGKCSLKTIRQRILKAVESADQAEPFHLFLKNDPAEDTERQGRVPDSLKELPFLKNDPAEDTESVETMRQKALDLLFLKNDPAEDTESYSLVAIDEYAMFVP